MLRKLFNNVDQRYYQLIVLFSLFLFATFYLKLPHITLTYAAVVMLSAQAFQYYFCWLFKVKYDPFSTLLASFSTVILLETYHIPAMFFVSFVIVASKFIFRFNDKHIFIPNNIAMVLTMLMFPGLAFIPIYNWGVNSMYLGITLIILGTFVASSVKKLDMPIFFFAEYSFSILVFSYLNIFSGDILLYLVSLPITLFAFFNLTDPKPIPNTRLGRFVFVTILVLTSNIIYIFAREFTPSFFFALPIACLFSPVIDKYFKGEKFIWNNKTA